MGREGLLFTLYLKTKPDDYLCLLSVVTIATQSEFGAPDWKPASSPFPFPALRKVVLEKPSAERG